MVSLKFLPAIIPLILGEYFLLTLFVFWYSSKSFIERKRKRLTITEDERENLMSIHSTSSQTYYHILANVANLPFYTDFFEGADFHIRDAYSSCLEKWSPKFALVLAMTRLAFFGYLLGAGALTAYIVTGGRDWIFFTIWNLDIISIFYFLAFCNSVIGLNLTRTAQNVFVKENELSDDFKNKLHFLGHAVHIFFEVCASTAFFVTIVDFLLLSSKMEFYNVTQHLITSLSFIVEISLNSLPVFWGHIWIQMSWILLYVIYAWIMVGAGALRDWPYDFMDVSDATCFLWYNVLFVVAILFYWFLQLLNYMKMRLLNYFDLLDPIDINNEVSAKSESVDLNY